MEASENLERDVRVGLIAPERLIDLIVGLQNKLQKLKHELEGANEKIKELKNQL